MTPRDLSRKAMIQDYAAQDGRMKLSRLIDRWGLAKSKAEAERLMMQGAVEWDGKKVTDATFSIDLNQEGDHILRVGKKPPFLVRIIA
jgi:tyrosyl-tRNA synthetase